MLIYSNLTLYWLYFIKIQRLKTLPNSINTTLITQTF